VAFVDPNQPNLPDYLTWLGETVQIPTAALPSNSPWPGYAFTQAMALTLSGQGAIPGIMYSLAVYNCATALLFLITPDQPNQTYFADARSSETSTNFPNGGFGLLSPLTGLVVSTSDENTSTTLTAPTWAAGMTVDDLGFYQTIWGRYYLAYIQKFGPTVWGLT
jgi:hypothetical protein